MGKYLHRFGNENQFFGKYYGSGYTVPWVSYSTSGECTAFTVTALEKAGETISNNCLGAYVLQNSWPNYYDGAIHYSFEAVKSGDSNYLIYCEDQDFLGGQITCGLDYYENGSHTIEGVAATLTNVRSIPGGKVHYNKKTGHTATIDLRILNVEHQKQIQSEPYDYNKSLVYATDDYFETVKFIMLDGTETTVNYTDANDGLLCWSQDGWGTSSTFQYNYGRYYMAGFELNYPGHVVFYSGLA